MPGRALSLPDNTYLVGLLSSSFPIQADACLQPLYLEGLKELERGDIKGVGVPVVGG